MIIMSLIFCNKWNFSGGVNVTGQHPCKLRMILHFLTLLDPHRGRKRVWSHKVQIHLNTLLGILTFKALKTTDNHLRYRTSRTSFNAKFFCRVMVMWIYSELSDWVESQKVSWKATHIVILWCLIARRSV